VADILLPSILSILLIQSIQSIRMTRRRRLTVRIVNRQSSIALPTDDRGDRLSDN